MQTRVGQPGVQSQLQPLLAVTFRKLLSLSAPQSSVRWAQCLSYRFIPREKGVNTFEQHLVGSKQCVWAVVPSGIVFCWYTEWSEVKVCLSVPLFPSWFQFSLICYPFPLPSCYSILFWVRQFELFRKWGMIELYRFTHFYTVWSMELGFVWKQTFWGFTVLSLTCCVCSVFSKVSFGHFLVRKSLSQCPGSDCPRRMPSLQDCWAQQGRVPFRAYDHGLWLEQKDCWCFAEDCRGVFQFVFSGAWYLSVALGPQLLKNRGYCFPHSWQGARLPLGDTALTER